MDGRLTWTDCDEAGDYVVPNVLSPRDLVSRPDNMDETVPHTPTASGSDSRRLDLCHLVKDERVRLFLRTSPSLLSSCRPAHRRLSSIWSLSVEAVRGIRQSTE